MEASRTNDGWVEMWCPPALEGVEVYRGVCVTAYPRYVPDDYKIGAMVRGAQWHASRGERRVAPEGCLIVVQPGEAVSGSAVDAAGYAWRLVALEPRLLRDAAAGLGLRAPDGPDFPDAIVRDEHLLGQFADLHVALEPERNRVGTVSALGLEGRLAAFLTEVIARCAEAQTRPRQVPGGDPAVRLAREYLQDHLAASVSLDDLAGAVGAGNRFRLARSFSREVGVPPHAYQIQARVRRAKALLAGGAAPAEAAFAVGFGSQSHLTRHFTPLVGVPPGAYRRAYAVDRVAVSAAGARRAGDART